MMGRKFFLADVGWDGKKYRQFVDLDDDSLSKATKALVFIAVCEFACTFIIMRELRAAAELAINNCET